ncbi:MAG TPA: hypothetical protein VHX86_19540 [Tepidisphaeraceae bacterium]|jgi:hypothetical protein|nr:hypothetical protein [Tepidisphaeraceae bacterium]
MTVTIALPPDDEKKLARLAAANGTDTAEYVRRIIKKEIDAPLSITQAAEPFAGAVQSSGIGDDEFTSTLQQAKTEARSARRSPQQGPA